MGKLDQVRAALPPALAALVLLLMAADAALAAAEAWEELA
jgi:hypothetical protein